MGAKNYLKISGHSEVKVKNFAKQETLNSLGFTIIEVLISVAIFMIVVAVVSSLVVTSTSEQNKNGVLGSASQTRLHFISILQNSTAWQNTVDDTTNTTMDCLRRSTLCAGGGNFKLIGSDASVDYDGTSATSGFTSEGAKCNTYSDTIGNSACPLHIILKWDPVCSTLPCSPKQVKISGDFKFNPQEQKKFSWNTENYHFNVFQNIEIAKVIAVALSTGFGFGMQDHTCALMSTGTMKCWGGNGLGELGDGTTTRSNIPVAVTGLSRGVKAIAVAPGYSCAVTNAGGVKCWGYNYTGKLGNGTFTDSSVPVDVLGLSSGAVSISMGRDHSCALLSSGGVRCWGTNGAGQLGDGTTTLPFSSVAVTGLSSGVKAVYAGNNFSCVLMSSGGVKCWGFNYNGVVGDGTTTDKHIPTDVVGLSSGVQSLNLEKDHVCAVMVAGTVKCWGVNYGGQLGDGTTTDSNVPVSVVGVTGVSSITLGAGFTIALLSSGAVKSWGDRSNGNVGDGITPPPYSASIPVDPVGLATAGSALALSNIDSVHGGDHGCAITPTGMKCWGTNSFGELGNGLRQSIPPMSPVDVIALVGTVKSVTVTNLYTCAIMTSGKLMCWGYNFYGQLGVGSGASFVTVPTTVSL